MVTRALLTLLLVHHVVPAPAHSQSEAALKEYFEGRTVKLKIAMPGTEDGVETSERMEGRLKVSSRVYSTNAGVVTAEFVEGVLIRYTITSN